MADHRPQAALELRNLKVHYGGIQAVKGVTLAVQPHSLAQMAPARPPR